MELNKRSGIEILTMRLSHTRDYRKIGKEVTCQNSTEKVPSR